MKEARTPTERQVVETYQLAQAFDNIYIGNATIERNYFILQKENKPYVTTNIQRIISQNKSKRKSSFGDYC
ncbi:hypothetical protein MWH30_10465 [Fuchsiella alkaliacetigena]|nr:hypothetical protein [Fuchsiella alkaliacetigena]